MAVHTVLYEYMYCTVHCTVWTVSAARLTTGFLSKVSQSIRKEWKVLNMQQGLLNQKLN